MSYQNLLMYSAVIPSGKNDKHSGNVISGDDPRSQELIDKELSEL
jgi:hypothetical protein